MSRDEPSGDAPRDEAERREEIVPVIGGYQRS
jgi:hypothetical protein